MTRMRTFFVFLLIAVAAPLLAGEAGPRRDSRATTILVVRHAEAVQGDDPALTARGTARARALAEAAKDAGVTSVYVTQFRRTRDTAAPLAERTGAKVVQVDVDRATIREQMIAMAKRIATEHRGEAVLVVGHSNTVPMVVEALSSVKVPAIAHEEHHHLYIVTLEDGVEPRVIAARYGVAPSE